ncbi:MAG: DUF6943 family protein [Bacteroidales bacterium]
MIKWKPSFLLTHSPPKPHTPTTLFSGAEKNKALVVAVRCKIKGSFIPYCKTLSFGLWKAKHFHQFLTGSVIPFIRISDFKRTIKAQAEAVSKDKYAFVQDVHKVKLIERKEKQMYETLALLADVKKAMMYRHFKR